MVPAWSMLCDWWPDGCVCAVVGSRLLPPAPEHSDPATEEESGHRSLPALQLQQPLKQLRLWDRGMPGTRSHPQQRTRGIVGRRAGLCSLQPLYCPRLTWMCQLFYQALWWNRNIPVGLDDLGSISAFNVPCSLRIQLFPFSILERMHFK